MVCDSNIDNIQRKSLIRRTSHEREFYRGRSRVHEVYHFFDTILTHATELHLILVQALIGPNRRLSRYMHEKFELLPEYLLTLKKL